METTDPTDTRARLAPPTHESDGLLWFFGNLVDVKLRRRDTGGVYALTEHWGDAGDMPPLHVHRNDDEVFYVLAGEIEFHVEGAAPMIASAGATLLAPRGMAHTYRVVSAEGARWLVITSPGDFQPFVEEISVPAAQASVPPHPDGPPPAEVVEHINTVAARHGIEILGPPGALPGGTA